MSKQTLDSNICNLAVMHINENRVRNNNKETILELKSEGSPISSSTQFGHAAGGGVGLTA